MGATSQEVVWDEFDPITPPVAESQVQGFIDALEQTSADFRRLRNDEASKRADYKVALAKKIVEVKERLSVLPARDRGSADDREAEALVACESEFREWLVAEAASEACLERQRSLRAEINGATSLNASARILGGGSG